jgi:hypothetical protein
LTPEKVPIPPAAAQAPAVRPLEIPTPFPPSIRGNTSRPERRILFNLNIKNKEISASDCNIFFIKDQIVIAEFLM